MEQERRSNLCAQESSNQKKESVDFLEKRMSGEELKLFFKIKDSSHIGSCAFKV